VATALNDLTNSSQPIFGCHVESDDDFFMRPFVRSNIECETAASAFIDLDDGSNDMFWFDSFECWHPWSGRRLFVRDCDGVALELNRLLNVDYFDCYHYYEECDPRVDLGISSDGYCGSNWLMTRKAMCEDSSSDCRHKRPCEHT
jgi:hypothetical protein